MTPCLNSVCDDSEGPLQPQNSRWETLRLRLSHLPHRSAPSVQSCPPHPSCAAPETMPQSPAAHRPPFQSPFPGNPDLQHSSSSQGVNEAWWPVCLRGSCKGRRRNAWPPLDSGVTRGNSSAKTQCGKVGVAPPTGDPSSLTVKQTTSCGTWLT